MLHHSYGIQYAVCVIMLMAGTSAVDAATKPDLAECAMIDTPLNRLACYDQLAAKHRSDRGSNMGGLQAASRWATLTSRDPLTDQMQYFASITADSGKNRLGQSVTMTIRCQNNKTEWFINWKSYLGTDKISTRYRIDKRAAERSLWPISTDKEAAFFPPSPVETLKKLAESTSFVAEVTPYNERPIIAIFDTTGAERAFTEIRNGCHW